MILIIGAGLSGLLTGYRLQKKGIPFKIIEARSRIGGRINTLNSTNQTPVEMGDTWFTEAHHNLQTLLDELEIPYFKQYMEGTAFVQASAILPAESIEIPRQAPSYRISGGSSNLIDRLYSKLHPDDVIINQTVKEIRYSEKGIQVFANKVFEGKKVVLAIPPKLWAKNILFEPNLPQNLMNIARETHTWMEDSIKVALTYSVPFWQQKTQSGTLFSNTGPMTELYDHCNHERTTFALCGFCSTSFKHLNFEERKEKIITQLKNVFGEKATHYIDYKECIWSQEFQTFQTSETLLFPHQNNGHPIFGKTFYDENLYISSAEAASEFPGYMDGAVFIGNDIALKLM